MKIAVFAFLCSFVMTAQAATVTPSGIEISGNHQGNNASLQIKSGSTASVLGNANTIYVFTGGTLSSLIGYDNIIYAQSGAAIGDITDFNELFPNTIFSGTSGDSAIVWMSDWLYTATFPWAYSTTTNGWLYFVTINGVQWVNNAESGEWRVLYY